MNTTLKPMAMRPEAKITYVEEITNLDEANWNVDKLRENFIESDVREGIWCTWAPVLPSLLEF
jgi:hypothetical protein